MEPLRLFDCALAHLLTYRQSQLVLANKSFRNLLLYAVAYRN